MSGTILTSSVFYFQDSGTGNWSYSDNQTNWQNITGPITIINSNPSVVANVYFQTPMFVISPKSIFYNWF